MVDFPNASVGAFLLHGLNQVIDQTERDRSQYQNNRKENKSTQTAILESLSAQNFYAIKYSVGQNVKSARDQCVVNDFQVNAPK